MIWMLTEHSNSDVAIPLSTEYYWILLIVNNVLSLFKLERICPAHWLGWTRMCHSSWGPIRGQIPPHSLCHSSLDQSEARSSPGGLVPFVLTEAPVTEGVVLLLATGGRADPELGAAPVLLGEGQTRGLVDAGPYSRGDRTTLSHWSLLQSAPQSSLL